MSLPRNDPRHGTANGYHNLGCRCQPCKDAWAAYYRERLHRLGRSRPAEIVRAERRAAAEARDNHGTVTRYGIGCRCGECTRAMRDMKRRSRERNRVPCSHGCGTMVLGEARDKPPECKPCAMKRVHAERRAAA